MRLTTKGRFAVTAMIDLAQNQDKGPVTLAGISERQSISLAYLEQLFSKLRRNHVVKSVRGPGGGYVLSRSADDVSIANIVFAVNEPLDTTRCGGSGNCQNAGPAGQVECITHNLWASLNEKIVDYLQSVSLQNLVDHHREKYEQPITMHVGKTAEIEVK